MWPPMETAATLAHNSATSVAIIFASGSTSGAECALATAISATISMMVRLSSSLLFVP